MTVHLYTLCWNEADILPFFFRHYDPVVDRYVVADDGSTDGSLDILRAHPKVEVRRFQRVVTDSFVLSQQRFQNEVWTESRGRADWVIITAIDEHLTVAGGLGPYLARCKAEGVTLMVALGYQMVSEAFPEPHECLVETRRRGAPFGVMNKLGIFNPDALTDTGFEPGRHMARPKGRLVFPRRDELMLFHYKLMGKARMLARHREQATGLGPLDQLRGLGLHYSHSEAALLQEWEAFDRSAIDLGGTGFDPAREGCHAGKRWWRRSSARRAASELWRSLRHRLGRRA